MTLITRSSNTTDLPESPYLLFQAYVKKGWTFGWCSGMRFLFAGLLVSACVSVGSFPLLVGDSELGGGSGLAWVSCICVNSCDCFLFAVKHTSTEAVMWRICLAAVETWPKVISNSFTDTFPSKWISMLTFLKGFQFEFKCNVFTALSLQVLYLWLCCVSQLNVS